MMTAKASVSFKSGIRSLTPRSTVEAERVAAALAMREAAFCSNMMTELGFKAEWDNVPLYIDDYETLHVMGNRTFSARTKHVHLRFFYVREMVQGGKIKILGQ